MQPLELRFRLRREYGAGATPVLFVGSKGGEHFIPILMLHRRTTKAILLKFRKPEVKHPDTAVPDRLVGQTLYLDVYSPATPTQLVR